MDKNHDRSRAPESTDDSGSSSGRTRYFPVATSVVLRAGLLSTLWVSLALIALVSVSAFFYRDANERSFERLLGAHLYSLIGAVSLSSEGLLQGMPDLGDIRYHDPASGWYWEVVLQGTDIRLRSSSFSKQEIVSPSETEIPFDESFTRHYRTQNREGTELLIVETDIVMEVQNQVSWTQPSEHNTVARFRIVGNRGEVEKRLDDFWAMMRWYLGAFILMSGAINAIMITLGLKPLKKIERALSAVRNGKASHIDMELPAEIVPMAREMNALIDNQRHMTQRFRTQLGNLAHAMKTPLAIMLNEIQEKENEGDDKNRLILEQVKVMQTQIQHYLQRAQMAAQRGLLIARTDVKPVAERMGRVIGKLFPSKQLHIDMTLSSLIFAGDAQDMEEIIGNLLENAGKWARCTIWLRVHKIESETDVESDGWLRLVVEDDGAGLKEQEWPTALQRGRRLDETVSGSGLGLSIVAELVGEYGGRLTLDRSPLGGLRVEVALPMAKNG